MTRAEARQVLLLHRPGVDDERDPEFQEALAWVQQDPGLRAWFEEHTACQRALRQRFRAVEPPPELQARLRALTPARRRPFISWPLAGWAAAAALLVLGLWLSGVFRPRPVPDQFADFRARMVSTVLREYHMDIVTNGMGSVRAFLANRGAPADYVLPPGVERLALTGGGVLRWRGHPVSMVCFDRGDKEMLFLFVLERSALPDAPPGTPQLARVNKLLTASWTQDNRSYVLAGPEDAEFLRKYL